MISKTSEGRQPDLVRQFSVFIANRVGRLHDLVQQFSGAAVHVLALTVLDTTDSSIIRLIVDDPDKAREQLVKHEFAFTESPLVVVELPSTEDLARLMAALLEAELNVNYLYSFIPHPNGKSLLAVSLEDNELAEQALSKSRFKVLRQADVSR